MNKDHPTSFRLSRDDKENLCELVKYGIFISLSDAGRSTMRRGIQVIKEERGIGMQRHKVKVTGAE